MYRVAVMGDRKEDEDDEKFIPTWLRWTFITINRVGFPIVAFLMMWYLCQVSIAKVITSVDQNTLVLFEVRDTLSRIDGGESQRNARDVRR